LSCAVVDALRTGNRGTPKIQLDKPASLRLRAVLRPCKYETAAM
jgi:hypothetical protein